VLEGGDLGGGGGGLHLLAEAGDLAVAVLDVELLEAAEGLLFGEGFVGFGEGYFGFGAGGLGGGDAERSVGQLGAEAAELEVLSLEDDEMFEIGVHRMGSPFAGTTVERLARQERGCRVRVWLAELAGVSWGEGRSRQIHESLGGRRASEYNLNVSSYNN